MAAARNQHRDLCTAERIYTECAYRVRGRQTNVFIQGCRCAECRCSDTRMALVWWSCCDGYPLRRKLLLSQNIARTRKYCSDIACLGTGTQTSFESPRFEM